MAFARLSFTVQASYMAALKRFSRVLLVYRSIGDSDRSFVARLHVSLSLSLFVCLQQQGRGGESDNHRRASERAELGPVSSHGIETGDRFRGTVLRSVFIQFSIRAPWVRMEDPLKDCTGSAYFPP